MHLKRLCSAALAAVSVAALAPQASALAGVSGWALGEVGKAEAAGLAPRGLWFAAAKESITRAEFCAVSLRLFESSTGRVAELTGDRLLRIRAIRRLRRQARWGWSADAATEPLIPMLR